MAVDGWSGVEVVSGAIGAVIVTLTAVGGAWVKLKKSITSTNAGAIDRLEKKVDAAIADGHDRARRVHGRLDDLDKRFVTKSEMEHRDHAFDSALEEHATQAVALSSSIDGLRNEFHVHTRENAKTLGAIDANLQLLLDVRGVQ